MNNLITHKNLFSFNKHKCYNVSILKQYRDTKWIEQKMKFTLTIKKVN